MAVKNFETLKSARDFLARVSPDANSRPSVSFDGGGLNGAVFIPLKDDGKGRKIACVARIPSDDEVTDFKASIANAEKMIAEADAKAKAKAKDAGSSKPLA